MQEPARKRSPSPKCAWPFGKKKNSMIIQGYDVVGDVHGHADPLHRLLDKLDYAEVDDMTLTRIELV
jgi:hypothetical protein